MLLTLNLRRKTDCIMTYYFFFAINYKLFHLLIDKIIAINHFDNLSDNSSCDNNLSVLNILTNILD